MLSIVHKKAQFRAEVADLRYDKTHPRPDYNKQLPLYIWLAHTGYTQTANLNNHPTVALSPKSKDNSKNSDNS